MAQTPIQIVFTLLDARRRRDIDSVKAVLHAEVVHQGVTDELVCHNREQVLENVRRGFQQDDDGINHLELVDAGERVVLGLAGPRFRDVPWAPLDGQLFIVHTVKEGLVVHMHDYLNRADAMAAAGASPTAWT
jgi:hypothetical protein